MKFIFSSKTKINKMQKFGFNNAFIQTIKKLSKLFVVYSKIFKFNMDFCSFLLIVSIGLPLSAASAFSTAAVASLHVNGKPWSCIFQRLSRQSVRGGRGSMGSRDHLPAVGVI